MIKAKITIKSKNRESLLRTLDKIKEDIKETKDVKMSIASFVDLTSFSHGLVDACYTSQIGEDDE